jgi:hypothetical protein
MLENRQNKLFVPIQIFIQMRGFGIYLSKAITLVLLCSNSTQETGIVWMVICNIIIFKMLKNKSLNMLLFHLIIGAGAWSGTTLINLQSMESSLLNATSAHRIFK